MIKVITADEERLGGMCASLAAMVSERSGAPDLIVGIRSGGAMVADRLSASFPEAALAYVVARRPSTAAKKRSGGILRSVLRVMPVPVLDFMRIVESRVLKKTGSPYREVALDMDDVSAGLLATPGKKILVVDDAVDSGHTLYSVLVCLREKAPQARIESAVITVTTTSTVVEPDYTLYDNLTLVRFPWSMDAR